MGYNISCMKNLCILCAALLIGASITAATVRDFSVAHAAAVATATTTATSTLQQQIDANNQQIANLNQEIATYQVELQKVGADKKTLQAAINALDLQRSEVETQVAVTQHQISATQLQIQQLGGEISDTQDTIATDQAALGENLRNLQKAEDQSLLMQILSSSGTLVQAWSDINATLQLQDGVQNEMQMLQTQESSLADSRTASKQKQSTLASQQQTLTSQQQSLAATVQSKSQLLTETKAQESTYEKLLAAAEAELKSFSAFTQNAGGSKLLGNQTVCDSWGCYYNQRDTAWGSDSLDGTQYTLASDGCLVASMAMVMTHYGYRDVTPVTINSNPNNFAAYSAGSLLVTINVDGMTATRKATTINATLATGNPVIIGLNAYGGTHFVVFTSGTASSNYLMRDPYIANGKDINFSANYSMKDIFSIAKVVIGS
jgi:peptidoglycan hydrolase CwlO-like protein